MTRTHRTVLAVVGALAAVLASTGFASGPAGPDGESVASFDAVVEVDARGDVHVTETIAYVFGTAPRHGLRRELKTREDVRDRARPVSAVTASSPSGAPSPVQVTDVGGLTVIRVGDPAQSVTGRQTYVLRYTVAGAVDRVGTSPTGPPSPYDELSWDVTGTGWDVPIDRVSVLVAAPRPATAAACHRNPEGSTGPCTGVPGPVSTFSAQGLPPGQGMGVSVAWPPGTATPSDSPSSRAPGVPAAGPGQPSVLGETFGFALLIAVLVGLLFLVRWFPTWAATDPTARPRPTPTPTPTPTRPTAPCTPGRAGAQHEVPRAPGGLLPGQLATLRDGRATTAAVTATLVDLATRGFLRIRAVPGPRRRLDWLLLATPRPAGDRLLPYEEALLDAVFAGQGSALLGHLSRHHVAAVRRALVDDAVAHGRLRRTARHPLGRTPAGDTLADDIARFREELAAIHPDGVDAAGVFGRGLSYAVALGATADWVDRFRPVVEGFDLGFYAVSRRVTRTEDTCDGIVTFTTALDRAVGSGPSWSGGSGSGGSWSGGSGSGGSWSGGSWSGGSWSGGGSSSSDWSSGGGSGCGGSSGGGSW